MAKQSKKEKYNKYVLEYLKCKNDFHYFCGTYIYIEMPGGDILLSPYQKQKELIDIINVDNKCVVLKSRQIGISTIIQAYCCWLCIFYDNTVIGLISKDGREATDFARTIRGMIEKLPVWMKPMSTKSEDGRGFAKKTEQSFILTNGSKVYASTVNPQAPGKTLRGKAITFLVIDEAAWIYGIEEAWTSMVPALSTSQTHARKNKVPYGTIILSTPNKTTGIGAWYFNRYTNAINNTGSFKPFIIHWKMIPELADDSNWYSQQCEMFDNDPKKIAQELDLKFLPSEGSFFESATVEAIQNAKEEPIEKIKLFNGEAWTFKKTEKDRHYLIGVDTASEHGEDKSAITIYDYQTLEQVWEYVGKCKVKDFTKVVKVACSLYRNNTLIIESNSYGNQVVEEISESPDFSLMLYKEKRGETKFVDGLSTNAKTRPLMIDALYSFVTQFPEIIKSERLALELSGLISKKNGRVEADASMHDDLAMSCAMCMYVKKYDSARLMIEVSNEPNEQSVELTKIVDLNNDIKNNMNIFNMDNSDKRLNSDIIKEIKNNMEDYDGYVNLFDVFQS